MEAQSEEKKIEEVKKQETTTKTKFLKIVSIVLSLSFAIVLGLVAYYKEEFPLGWIIIGGVLILFFGLGLWFGPEIYKKYKEGKTISILEGKLPPAKSVDEIKNYAQTLIMNKEYADMIPFFSNSRVDIVGREKSHVFTCRATGVLTNYNYAIIVNAHYPEKLHTILINPTQPDVIRARNNLALEPSEPADVERTTLFDPLTGKQIITEKKTHKKPEEKKKEVTDVK